MIFHNTDTYSLFSLYKRGGIKSKAFKKKILGKKFGKKNFRKLWKNKFGKKILKKNVRKKFWKKNVGKINYKTKIFITKIYSNIDKCHTIFSLLAPFDKTGRKTGKTSVVYDSKKAVSRALTGRKECRDSKEVGRKDIYHGLRAVGNALTTWAISLHRLFEILDPLALTIKRRPLNTKRKSNVVHQLSYGVEFTGVNTSALILGTFRESE